MADPEPAEALPEEEDAVPEGLKKWQRINCAQYIGGEYPNGWPLAAIRDITADEAPGDNIVFPSVNHENLHASTNLIHYFTLQNHTNKSVSPPFPPSHWESSSSSSSRSQFGIENDDSSYSFSPSELQLSEPEKSLPENHRPPPPVKPTVGSASWWMFGLKVLYSKFNGIEQLFRYISMVLETILPLISPIGTATVAAVAVTFLYFRWRRKKLIRIIEHKNEDKFLIYGGVWCFPPN